MMMRSLAVLLLPLSAACATTAKDTPRTAFTSDRISVEVRGSGPDVILIPGLSSSPQVWEGAVAALPGYRYHLVQVAGFAGARAGANANGPVVPPVAEEIARYIREQRVHRPALVGHSLGGTLAMLVAARHPEVASKVMVVDMVPFMGTLFGAPDATPETVRPIAEQMRQRIAGGSGEQRRQAIEQMIATMIRTENLRAGPLANSLDSDASVSGQAMYDIIIADLRPELSNIKVPLTVLWVRPPSAPVSEAQMEQFYKLSYANVPQAVLKHIPNAYHFIMLDEPEVFQRELRTFLTR